MPFKQTCLWWKPSGMPSTCDSLYIIKTKVPIPVAHFPFAPAFLQFLHWIPCGPISNHGNSSLQVLICAAMDRSCSVVLLLIAASSEQDARKVVAGDRLVTFALSKSTLSSGPAIGMCVFL